MTYWDWDEIEAWCRALAERMPDWFEIEEVGQSREGRPLILVTVVLFPRPFPSWVEMM